jgi:hypothetical protein
VIAKHLLTIIESDYDRCERCSNKLLKSGFLVADQANRRAFLCQTHVVEALAACLAPVNTHRIGSAILDRTEKKRIGS